MRSLAVPTLVVLATVLATVLVTGPAGADLEDELGRSESRIVSEAYPLTAGRTVWEIALAERLERLGYERIRRRPEGHRPESHRPEVPGTYFWGHETFWIFRRAHRLDGRDHPALLVGLALDRDGRIRHGLDADGQAVELPADDLRLEPELLAESLDEERAVRRRVELERLPEHVWRAVLAAEDARFYEHPGVDPRSLARALLANLQAGEVVQGGSTITQQLIKNRDLSPRRTLGRKVSEALRALVVEFDHGKEQVLSAYLNEVYLGHVDGVAIHGLGTAARVYFSKPAAALDLAEAAALAGLIQSPNRRSPLRHPERLRERRDWVLGRLEELGWAEAGAVAAAKRQRLGVRRAPPRRFPARSFRAWVAAAAADAVPRRLGKGRGIRVETGLDPWLQQVAEEELRAARRRLGRRRGGSGASLGLALVALDAGSGAVLAAAGRAHSARRQPGSTVKPLLLLEAFDRCREGRRPLTLATRVADEPYRLDLPSGPWRPINFDRRFHGVVTVREALRESYNVPFVRLARHCGFAATAARLRRSGLPLGDTPPPSFTLGALEVSPVELAAAFTVFANLGERVRARPIRRIERPDGEGMERFLPRRRRVTRPESAWLVRDLLLDAAAHGTARPAAVPGLAVAAKTGTSSERRDAWLAGTAEGVVAVVWVGRDDGTPLGLTGTEAAAPIWRAFMARAAPARPPRSLERPPGVVEAAIDPRTGLRVKASRRGAVRELFRADALPPRQRFWRPGQATPVIR